MKFLRGIRSRGEKFFWLETIVWGKGIKVNLFYTCYAICQIQPGSKPKKYIQLPVFLVDNTCLYVIILFLSCAFLCSF